jgi:hypothetical protein
MADDNQFDNLDDFLSAVDAEKPQLAEVIKNMAPEHFEKVVSLFSQEWDRRNMPSVENMDDSMFKALLRRHGVG